jgi:hypothetical protein
MMIFRRQVCIYLLILIFSLSGLSHVLAANLYVDKGGHGATWNGVNGGTYTCSAGTGKGYGTIQAAASAMSGGDDIYIRGGTYAEQVTLSITANGSSSNYSSIQSYPGEWAIINPTTVSASTRGWVLGKAVSYADGQSASLKYWDIERLEITSSDPNARHGLWISGDHIIVKYCYIHGIKATNTGDNPGGLYCGPLRDSTIRYNYFTNNGVSDGSEEHHCAIGINAESDYQESATQLTTTIATDSSRSTTWFRGRNDIAYNYSVDTNGSAENGVYHAKAHQLFDLYEPTMTVPTNSSYKTWGNYVHHNISTGTPIGISAMTDFDNIYNNIIDSGRLEIQDGGYGIFVNGQCIYNNTIRGGEIFIQGEGAAYAQTACSPGYTYVYNNLLDNPASNYGQTTYYNFGSVDIPSGYSFNFYNYLTTHGLYMYRPSNTTTPVQISRLTGSGKGQMSIAAFNSYSGASDNWYKASSEGSDNLYTGSSGANAYITRGAHVISGSTTIANGGIGGNHPYLSGVTIPSYVGATNPSDNTWVAGVLGLNVSYFTSVTAGSTPTWIEGGSGGGTSSDTTAPAAPTGVNVNIIQ